MRKEAASTRVCSLLPTAYILHSTGKTINRGLGENCPHQRLYGLKYEKACGEDCPHQEGTNRSKGELGSSPFGPAWDLKPES